MKVCHILQYYTVVTLLLSCAHLLAAKALTDGEYQNRPNNDIRPVCKREAAEVTDYEDRHYVQSHQKYKHRRSPFGIVYKDGKPIGILEPISRIYEFQNLQDELNAKNSYNKRDKDAPNSGEDNYVKRNSENLESDNIIRSFRMNPHFQDKPMLNNQKLEKNDQKRDVKKADKAKLSTNGDSKLSVIENNLKEIISDLNSISSDDEDSENIDSVDKREAQMEDEDLDNGINKIGLTKETHSNSVGLSSESSIKEKKSADPQKAEEPFQETKKIADYRNEGESFIRQKRQQAGTKPDVNDIVKGLESSGDLTVSGNKSPLASASTTVEAEGKKGKGGDFEKREKQTAEDLDYEKRLQRNIQNKITEIKEQVKREIKALNSNTKSSPDDKLNLGDESNKLKQVVNDNSIELNEPEQKPREKRNLLEQETSDIDLAQNNEQESLVSHIRQKRHVAENDVDVSSDVNSNDIVENTDTREGVKSIAKQTLSANKVKRDSNVVDVNKMGFGVQNQKQDVAIAPAKERLVVTRAIATKNSKPTAAAVGGLDAEKLEKLVKESASLTESIKSERGARYHEGGTHVEVELHGPVKKPVESKAAKTENVNDDSVALVENHAESSDLVINNGKDAVVMKRDTKAKKDKSFHQNENNKKSVKIEEIETIPDNSFAPAQSGINHNYKDSEATTRITPSSSEVSEPKSFEMRRENADAKLKEETAQDSDIYSEKQINIAAADENTNTNSEDGDLSKRAISNQASVRQERKTEPVLSLEDMQALDSANNMKRRRRYTDDYDYNPRDKRDYDVQNMHFRNYRGDEDEADDESDEFDDDNFDDRTAVRKRAAQELENYDDLDGDYDHLQANDENAADVMPRMNKRNIKARDYVARLNEDAYDNTNYLYDANGRPLNRNKRQILENAGGSNVNMAALHGGGPMVRHLAAIRERNTHIENSLDKSKRLEKNFQNGHAGKSNQIISGLSENDIFGALPQSYEGELTRFKRVKRDDPAG